MISSLLKATGLQETGVCTGLTAHAHAHTRLPLSSPIQGADGSYSVRETRERRALARLTGSGAGLIDMQAAPLQSGKSERRRGATAAGWLADSDGHVFITPRLPRTRGGNVFRVESERRFLGWSVNATCVACVHSELEMIHALTSCF